MCSHSIIVKSICLSIFINAAIVNTGAQCTYFPNDCYESLVSEPPPPVTAGLIEAVQKALNGIPCGGPVTEILPDEGCYALTERYLSRTMMMDALWKSRNFNATYENGGVTISPPDKQDEYLQYLGCIVSMVLTKSTLINLPGKQWGGSKNFKYNSGYFCLIRQVATDINAAYDAACLRRPIIQGAVMERIDFEPLPANGPPNLDKAVRICPHIIEEFRNDFTPADEAYYLDNGAPKTNLFFDIHRIRNTDYPYPDIIKGDITRIECKMFFYHCARLQIDAGYTSLVMGIIGEWAEKDRSDGQFDDTYSTFEKMRDYANSLGQELLLTGEPCSGCDFSVPHPTIPGEKLFIFDFLGCPLRPREITNPPHDDIEDTYHCTSGYAGEDIALFNTAPCLADAAIAAAFDYCTIDAFHSSVSNTSGYAPNGCKYDQLPYVVYFDYSDGEKYIQCQEDWVKENLAKDPAQSGFQGPGDVGPGTWGYSDCNWFSQLSPECQAAWFKHTFCRVREMSNGLGFMQIPGWVYLPHADPVTCEHTGEFFYMGNNPELWEAAIEVSQINTPPEIINSSICEDYAEKCEYICGGQTPPQGYLFNKKLEYYRFCVAQPDCSSIYTWHIRKNNGSWLPMGRGTCYNFKPTSPGTYTIGLRQDNLALPVGTWGAAITPHDITVTIPNPACCEPVPLSFCRPHQILDPGCPELSTAYEVRDFTFTLGETQHPVNARLFATDGQIDSYHYDPETGTMTGRYFTPTDSETKNFNVRIRYLPEPGAAFETAGFIEQFPPCDNRPAEREEHSQPASRVIIQPNPASDWINVDLNTSGTSIINIIDISGNVIKNIVNNGRELIDISGLPSGIYWVKAFAGEGNNFDRQKLVIINYR